MITLETCLRCSYNTIRDLSNVVDHWIVDIKSMNPFIYQEYTGVMSGVLQHLQSIREVVQQDKVTIKVPHIPDYNDDENLDDDIEEIKRRFCFTNFSKIEYKKL